MSFEETNEIQTSVIPRGTVITGNIQMTGKLEMYGQVIGDINASDRVDICGNVNGSVNADTIHAKDSFIVGKIICAKDAVIHENTVLLGDVSAENLVVEGAIQGNLDVKGCVKVGAKAIMESDIKAKSIEVSNGASIVGNCTLCYADKDALSVFPPEPEKPSKPVKAAETEKPSKPVKAAEAEKSSKSVKAAEAKKSAAEPEKKPARRTAAKAKEDKK